MSASSRPAVSSERVASPFRDQSTAALEAPAADAPSPRTPSTATAIPLPLRPMTGFEEEFLEESAGELNTSRLCNDLLARCAVPPGEGPGGALAAVREYSVAARDLALLDLRRKSLGDRVSMEVDCPSCGGTNEVDFDLSVLPIELEAVEGPLEVPIGDQRRAVLRLPTAGDQEALLEAPPKNHAERRTRLLARLLLEIGEEQGPFSELQVRALPSAERRAMEQAIDAATPDLALDMAVSCCDCACAFTSPFDVAVFFCLR
ncbi:MAG: hypothetical protein K0U98_20670 [Deltaproteobacteria bacterium]|nr:hypothetical protein [Deltaproteobacteria bacterium]